MEYGKKIKILSGIIVLLLSTYILGSIFSSGNINKKKASQPIFDKAIISKISAIKIDISENNVLLQKEDNKWSYTNNGKKYPAAVDKIDNFIDSVSKLTKYQIAGSNSESWEQFDLVQGKSKDAIFYDSSNNEIFSVHIGKKGPTDGSGEYIRTSLSDEVYLIDAPIIRYFTRDINYWSYLRIMPEDVDSNTIAAVKIKTDDKFADTMAMLNFSMKKDYGKNSSDWQDVSSGKAIDKNSADMLLNNIASLAADNFSENHITDKNAEIEIETDNHGRIFIDIKVIEEQKVLLGIRGNDYKYEAALYKVERVFNSVERINDELK